MHEPRVRQIAGSAGFASFAGTAGTAGFAAFAGNGVHSRLRFVLRRECRAASSVSWRAPERHPGARDVSGRSAPVGGFEHLPVMVDEVLGWLETVPAGLVVDATVGGGGHAAAILTAFPGLDVLGLDRDPAAVEAATLRLAPFGTRATVVHARFDELRAVVARHQGLGRDVQPVSTAGLAPSASVSAVLFDLGVSSPQLDRPERGFSFRADGPLDMRMDTTDSLTAADIVNGLDVEALTRMLRENADERYARRIAAAIVAARPVTSTARLAEIVSAAIPAPARRQLSIHPATRTFQAIRIEVNRELAVLGPAIDEAIDVLAPRGRCIVISYHSGEDRITKERFRSAETGGCTCPVGLPCVCGALPRGRRIKRSVTRPSADELADNQRAASAKGRVFEVGVFDKRERPSRHTTRRTGPTAGHHQSTTAETAVPDPAREK